MSIIVFIIVPTIMQTREQCPIQAPITLSKKGGGKAFAYARFECGSKCPVEGTFH